MRAHHCNLLLALTLIGLCSCATPYAKKSLWNATGGGSGWEDSKLGPDRYQLKFTGNGYTKPEAVLTMWHRRAAELCDSRPYEAEFTEGTTPVEAYGSEGYVGTLKFPVVEGTVHCAAKTASI